MSNLLNFTENKKKPILIHFNADLIFIEIDSAGNKPKCDGIITLRDYFPEYNFINQC